MISTNTSYITPLNKLYKSTSILNNLWIPHMLPHPFDHAWSQSQVLLNLFRLPTLAISQSQYLVNSAHIHPGASSPLFGIRDFLFLRSGYGLSEPEGLKLRVFLHTKSAK
jgi:hypothetical protein